MTELDSRQILGLPENFTKDQLKNQYRKLVLKYHPDRNNGDKSKFIIIQKAYQILLEAKENPAYVFRQSPNSPHKNDIYQERRQAEEAYKSKVKQYYIKQKRTKSNAEYAVNSFSRNLKTAIKLVLVFLVFWTSLIICFAFGVWGVLLFLILFGAIMSRVEW